MFDWIKHISDRIKDLNTSVNSYKAETNNQTLPSIAYVNRAKKHIDKMQLDEARKLLCEAMTITEKDPLVYKYLGICEEKAGNFEEAIKAYKKSAEINPQDNNIWHKLGMAQITLRLYDDAEKSLERADRISPVNTDIQTAYGIALMKQKKYPQAHEKFIKAITINRYNFSAMLLAAIVEVRMDKYDDAETKLSFLIKANPNESCMYELANLYYLKENYESAINYALKSIQCNQGMLPSYLLLGRIYSIKFDYENSTKYFHTAEELELKNTILYIEWGDALVRCYRFEEAKEIYRKALIESTEDTEALLGMAICSAQTNDFERVYELVKILDEKAPDSPILKEVKGLSEFAYGNTDKAVELFKQALSDNPKSYYNYFRLAKCYEKLQKSDMVKDSYDKLLKFNPDFVDGYIEYAKYLIENNDIKDAQRKLRKAEKLREADEEVLNLLFYTSYILVKENICEYNIKEAISLANKIKLFKYPELKAELEELLAQLKKENK